MLSTFKFLKKQRFTISWNYFYSILASSLIDYTAISPVINFAWMFYLNFRENRCKRYKNTLSKRYLTNYLWACSAHNNRLLNSSTLSSRIFFWKTWTCNKGSDFVPRRSGIEDCIPGFLHLSLSRDKGTSRQGNIFVPGQRDNQRSLLSLSRDVPSRT